MIGREVGRPGAQVKQAHQAKDIKAKVKKGVKNDRVPDHKNRTAPPQ